jgi:hypothetical protein
MKSTSIALTAFLISLWLSSLNAQEIVASLDAEIIGPITDGIPIVKEPEPEPIDFTVLRRHKERVYVEESPELPGLPAPKGKINVTVELVRQPTIADPPILPELEPEKPAAVVSVEESTKESPDTQLIFVSASVYKNTFTQFRIQASGPDAEEITGWSNIDFNHFTGFASYQIKGTDEEVREYALVMGIGDINTLDPSDAIPRLPDLATQGPAFVLTGGDIKNRATKELVESMHILYKAEGERLAEAYRLRTKAYEERKAFLLANPPKPKDVTLRFWKRNEPSPKGLQAMEEAQP